MKHGSIFKSFLSILLAQLLIFQSAAWAANSFKGTVTGVIDGATIKVSTPDGERIVNLAGINVEAPATMLGKQAQQKLQKLLMGKTVTVEAIDTEQSGAGSIQKYGSGSPGVAEGSSVGQRIAHGHKDKPMDGKVFLDGEDIALVLLGAGLAWILYSILEDMGRQQREEEARKKRTGVWTMAPGGVSVGVDVQTGGVEISPAKQPTLEQKIRKDHHDDDDDHKEKYKKSKGDKGRHLGWEKQKNKGKGNH